MRKYKERNKATIVLTILLLFVAFFTITTNTINSYYNDVMRGKEFTVDENETVYNIGEYEELNFENIGNGVRHIYSRSMELEPGRYNVDVQYSYKGREKIVLELKSNMLLDSENNKVENIFVKEFDNSSESFIIDFEIKEFIPDAQFVFSVPSGESIRIGRISLLSDNVKVENVNVFLTIEIIAYLFALCILWKNKPIAHPLNINDVTISGRRMSFVLLVIMASVSMYLIYPLLDSRIYVGHDLLFHINRIEGMAQSIKSGQFPVRIHSGMLNGYGYPNSLFYPELFFYIPAIMRAFGASLKSSYVFFILFINIITIFCSYISFSKFLDNRIAGMVTAIAYTMSAYRISNIYIRGAIGEVVAMAFIPMVLYGLYAVLYGNKKDWKYLTLGVCGLLQSHMLSIEITAVFCAVITVFSLKKLFMDKSRFWFIVKSLSYAVLINMWFLVPFLISFMKLKISVSGRNPKLSKTAVFDISKLFNVTDMSVMSLDYKSFAPAAIGMVFVFAFIVMLCMIICVKKTEKNKKFVNLGTISLIMVSVLFVMITSIFPWDFVQFNEVVSKIVGTMQFPSRILILITAGMALILGLDIVIIGKSDNKKILALSLPILLAVATYGNIHMDMMNTVESYNRYFDKYGMELGLDGDCISQGEYVSADSSISDMMSRGVEIKFSNNVSVTNLERNGVHFEFDYNIENYNENEVYNVIMPITYYPGYVAVIDGQEQKMESVDINYAGFNLTKQAGHAEVKYKESPTFMIADAISVFSVIIFIFNNKILKKQ